MIARLSNILIPEIKSLISAKLLIARQNKIDIHVEVVEPIDKVDTDLLSLIRVLSNLLDNAIEATSEIKDSWIRIAMFKEEKTVTIIIENSILELIDIKKINEMGYSSKGTGRGIGLHTVQKILKNDTSLFLETSSDQQVFSQVLKIAGNDL
nr:GHKL domain-containing protein [Enterococcus hulanensis]